jgi:dipeptidyl aminopeptidase/acylaminoacyl peptidase
MTAAYSKRTLKVISVIWLIWSIGMSQADEPKEKPVADNKKPTPKHFEISDVAKLVGLRDPQVSVDGKSIVVVVSRPDFDKDKFKSELVWVDIETEKQRVLTHDREGVHHPRWSTDGGQLAFLATQGAGKDAHPQIFIMPMNGGDARRITSAAQGVQHFSWSPDGRQIAFATADDPINKKEIEKHNDSFEVGNNDYLATEAPTPTHIWLVSSEGGEAKRLTSGSWSLPTVPPPGSPASPLSWSPDGKEIAFVRQARPQFGDSDQAIVQILNVGSGQVRSLTKRTSFESFPSFSPDGSKICYWYPRDGDPNNVNEIWLAPSSGGEGSCVTRAIDRCLLRSIWMPGERSLLVGGHDGTRVALWLRPAEGPAQKFNLGAASPSWSYWVDVNVGAKGGIAFTASESRKPTELYYMASPASPVRCLTRFNQAVADLDLSQMESITWEGPDGFSENGVLVKPPGFSAERKYPLVLLIHGGPQSASTETFSPLAEIIASHGYVVFQPNYRGSDNLGNAYMRAIFNDAGDGPGRDVMAGIEAVKKRGYIDSSRMAVSGWSYGGYMTTWMIGHYQVWKTAIAGAAVTDKHDEYNLSDFNVQERFAFGGSPWVGSFARAYTEQSPITYASQMRTPTLILATTGDGRVPITQSYKLFHALRDNGVETKFIAYPAPGHFPADPVRSRDVIRRWVEWLDRYLK